MSRADECDIVCFSHRPSLGREAIESVAPHKVRLLDTSGMESSTSALVMAAIASAPCDRVIVMRDKVRVTAAHIDEVVAKMKEGWALVHRIAIGFFGIDKELLRAVGNYDQRFGNGAEDADLIFRCGERGIGVYDRQLPDEHYRWDIPTSFDVHRQWVDLQSKWDYSDVSICPDRGRGYASEWRPAAGPKRVVRVDSDRPHLHDLGQARGDADRFRRWSEVDKIESLGDVLAGAKNGGDVYDWSRFEFVNRGFCRAGYVP